MSGHWRSAIHRESSGTLGVALGLLGAWPAHIMAQGSQSAPWVYVFNVGSRDVTRVVTAAHEVIATKPLGTGVRWLANMQDFFDGRHIWTDDLVGEHVEVVLRVWPPWQKI